MYLLELIRNKSAAFFTILFPSMLLMLFGRGDDASTLDQWHLYIAMANYAVQSSLFLSLGMSIAYNKESQWTKFLSTLPVSRLYRVVGQVVSMGSVGVFSLLLLIVVGIYWLPVTCGFTQTGRLFLSALLGGIPMGLLAMVLAHYIKAATARSLFVVANFLFFFSSFSIPTHGPLAVLRFIVPTCLWFSLSSNFTLSSSIDLTSLYGLSGYTIILYLMLIRIK